MVEIYNTYSYTYFERSKYTTPIVIFKLNGWNTQHQLLYLPRMVEIHNTYCYTNIERLKYTTPIIILTSNGWNTQHLQLNLRRTVPLTVCPWVLTKYEPQKSAALPWTKNKTGLLHVSTIRDQTKNTRLVCYYFYGSQNGNKCNGCVWIGQDH